MGGFIFLTICLIPYAIIKIPIIVRNISN